MSVLGTWRTDDRIVAAFPCNEPQKAYEQFFRCAGFEIFIEISKQIGELKTIYEKAFVIGFSVGATIAWLCCENVLCDGIVACYGSRIRAYTSLSPACPNCLLFAEEESFDLIFLIRELQDKKHVEINRFAAKHGFIDPFSEYYNPHESKRAEKLIFNVLEKFGPKIRRKSVLHSPLFALTPRKTPFFSLQKRRPFNPGED